MPSQPLNSNDPADRIDLLKRLLNAAFKKAKLWSGLVIGLQVFVFVTGIVSVFWTKVSITYPWIALPLSVVAACLTARASIYRGQAEALKRQHELADGLGKSPSSSNLADTKHALGALLPEDADALLRLGITYSSSAESGAKRLLENLVESTWFSKHLARWCGSALCCVFLTALVMSVSMLLWCVGNFSSPDVSHAEAAAKLVSATLVFMFSVGLVRSWLSFNRFSDKSQACEQQASQLLSGKTDTVAAVVLLAEYQLNRASAPMIPTWVWSLRKTQLNLDWDIRKDSL